MPRTSTEVHSDYFLSLHQMLNLSWGTNWETEHERNNRLREEALNLPEINNYADLVRAFGATDAVSQRAVINWFESSNYRTYLYYRLNATGNRVIRSYTSANAVGVPTFGAASPLIPSTS